jgi:hypothetical protein
MGFGRHRFHAARGRVTGPYTLLEHEHHRAPRLFEDRRVRATRSQ